jgi:hypothetical protein
MEGYFTTSPRRAQPANRRLIFPVL